MSSVSSFTEKTAILNQDLGFTLCILSDFSYTRAASIDSAHKVRVQKRTVLTGCVVKAEDIFLNSPGSHSLMITLLLLFDHMIHLG